MTKIPNHRGNSTVPCFQHRPGLGDSSCVDMLRWIQLQEVDPGNSPFRFSAGGWCATNRAVLLQYVDNYYNTTKPYLRID